MCHDVGMQFNTPTVNLWMTVGDFLKFAGDLRGRLSAIPVCVELPGCKYPAAKVGGDVTLHFTHYRSYAEAEDAWMRRRKRVDTSNVVLVVSDNSDATDEELAKFMALPYRKIMFVYSHRKAEILGGNGFLVRGDFSSGFNVTDFEGLSGRRFYHQFDFVSWLNG